MPHPELLQWQQWNKATFPASESPGSLHPPAHTTASSRSTGWVHLAHLSSLCSTLFQVLHQPPLKWHMHMEKIGITGFPTNLHCSQITCRLKDREDKRQSRIRPCDFLFTVYKVVYCFDVFMNGLNIASYCWLFNQGVKKQMLSELRDVLTVPNFNCTNCKFYLILFTHFQSIALIAWAFTLTLTPQGTHSHLSLLY